MANSVAWSRVFAEGAVIVVSILLAFAIDAWWDARQDLTLEHEYLERLESDLVSARERIGGYAERYEAVGEATRELIDLLEAATPPADTTQFVALALMAGRTGFDRGELTYDATFEELISTGNLRVIKDPVLRQALVEHFREARTLVEDVENLPQAYNRRIKSILGEAPLLYENGTLGLPARARERLLATLPDDAEMLSELRYLNAELRRGLAFTSAMTALDDLLAQVTANRAGTS